MKAEHKLPVVGLALGSGSARGWSHIGIILELEALGVRPQVVAATSSGALVGAVYVAGQLNEFAEWVGKLTMREGCGLMDFTLTGGVVKGERLSGFFKEHHNNQDIEKLAQRIEAAANEIL